MIQATRVTQNVNSNTHKLASYCDDTAAYFLADTNSIRVLISKNKS